MQNHLDGDEQMMRYIATKGFPCFTFPQCVSAVRRMNTGDKGAAHWNKSLYKDTPVLAEIRNIILLMIIAHPLININAEKQVVVKMRELSVHCRKSSRKLRN